MSKTHLEWRNDIAWITMDDGKVNAMSLDLLEELTGQFNKLAEKKPITVLTGRPGIFSAGFDMKTFAKGPEPSRRMVEAGVALIETLLAFPRPIVAACTGHAYPMGAFLMLSSDYRIGAEGSFNIGMNEVPIGLTVPYFAIALARHRLSRPAQALLTTGTMFRPSDAVGAGYLDQVVSADQLTGCAQAKAESLKTIDMPSYEATKTRLNAGLIEEIKGSKQRETIAA